MCKSCKTHTGQKQRRVVEHETRDSRAAYGQASRIGERAVEDVGQHVGSRSSDKKFVNHLRFGRQ